jgi:hypothetical protein
VKDLTGVGLRAGEEEKIELPRTHMSKRGLNKQFSPRPDDTEFREGSQRKEVNAWSTFENCWKETYPNLKIRASADDICSETK